MLIMGVAGILAGILVILILPETSGQSLPETMEEALQLGKRSRESPKSDSQTAVQA